ncbi:hypothetical protein VYU27_002301 [Nannochloropsis oceanica]
MLPSSSTLRTLLGRSSVAATKKTALSLLSMARRWACCSGTSSSCSSINGISSFAARGPTCPILLSLPQPQQRYRQSAPQQVHSRAFSSSPTEAAPAKTKKAAVGKGERTLLTHLRKSGAPTSALFEALGEKCKGSKLPRLQDLHALLLSTSTLSPTATKEENKRLILAAVHLFLHKNVEFSEQSAALFLRSMLRVDGLADAVDLLLEKRKRMGMWAQRKTLHIALHKLGGAKDTERLLALFEAMVPVMGIEHTARTYHLVIRGLLNAGEEKKALEVAGKASLALADSTQEMLKKAVEAEAGVQKEAEEQAQGEDGKEGEGENKENK